MNTTRKYLALDLETAKITDDASDWKLHRPLGISCAATLLSDSQPRRGLPGVPAHDERFHSLVSQEGT